MTLATTAARHVSRQIPVRSTTSRLSSSRRGDRKLRCARRGVVSDPRGLFERAAVLEIGGDPGRPETVVAKPGCDAGRGYGAGGSWAYAFACGSTVRVSLPGPHPIVWNRGLWDRRGGLRRRDRR
jgi:hypothetical protein